MKMVAMIGIPESEKESVRLELKLLQQFTHPNIVSYRVLIYLIFLLGSFFYC